MAAVLLELARDGRSVADLMDLGQRILGRRMVIQSESPNAISIDDCLNFDVVDDPILTKPNTLGSSDIVMRYFAPQWSQGTSVLLISRY